MAKYFVSIRVGDKHGDTVFAGHWEAPNAAAARVDALHDCFDKPVPESNDPNVTAFMNGVMDMRKRLKKDGFYINARKSNARD